MNVVQFLAILRARWWAVLLVLGVTVTAATVISLNLPKEYTAGATVVVDIRPDPFNPTTWSGGAVPTLMATHADVMRSERVMVRAIRSLRLGENANLRDQWLEATGGAGTLEQWLVGALAGGLSVAPSRESSVISVWYTAQDPSFAASMANAIAEAHVQTALELRTDPARQYSSFFDAQARDAREALERAQSRLSAFQRQKGIIATDERFDIETARLNELSSQLVALQAVAVESATRGAQARGSQGDQLQEVLSNPLVTQLRSDINRTEARLQELTTRLGDAHPQVVEARASLAELRARLDTETRRVTSSVGVTESINRSREAQLRQELDAQRARVLKMREVRDEGAVLVRDVESAQRQYDAVLTRLKQTSLESQTPQSSVSLLTRAKPPSAPSAPAVGRNIALSVLLGGLLATGIALLMEMFDRRVRTFDDVAAALDLPVIGVMPNPSAKRMIGGRKLTQMQQRVIGQGTPLLGRGA